MHSFNKETSWEGLKVEGEEDEKDLPTMEGVLDGPKGSGEGGKEHKEEYVD